MRDTFSIKIWNAKNVTILAKNAREIRITAQNVNILSP